MSDLITLSGGHNPYRPPGAEIVEIYNEYDGPLLGVLQQEGIYFLFDCIYGHVENLSLWLYSRISSETVERLNELEGSSFEDLKRGVQAAVPARIALAIEGVGVVAWADAMEYPDGVEAALRELIERFQVIQQRLTQSRGEVDELADEIDDGPLQLVCA